MFPKYVDFVLPKPKAKKFSFCGSVTNKLDLRWDFGFVKIGYDFIWKTDNCGAFTCDFCGMCDHA